MQLSIEATFSGPPTPSRTIFATSVKLLLDRVTLVSSASSSSRPGVFRLNLVRKKCIHILLLTVGMIGVLTVLFFTGESWLGGGWYYIPDRAITIALVFCIFWQIALITGTFFLSMRVNKRRHEHGSRKRWVLSCIPDYIAWIILILGIGYHLFFGENILNSVLENAKVGDLLALYGSYGTWLHIWMYGIYILACKEAVLLVGLLSELLLMRIPLRYHSGQNAVTFVSFYYLFCQNAIFRGISLLEAALVIPLCGVMLREAASPFSDYSSIMIYAAFMLLTGAVFVVLIVIGPVMRTLSYFYSWGQRKQIRELFCTEYFLMQPVSRNRSFTVTYHFIIDEQDAAGVYYLPLLTDISGWISPKKKAGKWKMLSFADGRTFEVSEHEAEAAKEMLSYASNRLYAQKVTGENRNNIPDAKETWNPLINPATTIYQKLVKIFLGLMVILFMMSYQILK